MLLSSIPVVLPEEEAIRPSRIVSEGEIPSPVNVPPGCGFHTRCPEMHEDCDANAPRLVEVKEGHFVRCHGCAEPIATAPTDAGKE